MLEINQFKKRKGSFLAHRFGYFYIVGLAIAFGPVARLYLMIG